jgi:hypothetical protein
MYNRFLGRLNGNNKFIEKTQFGFMKNLIIDKATCKVIKETLSALNDKLSVGGIFCD